MLLSFIHLRNFVSAFVDDLLVSVIVFACLVTVSFIIGVNQRLILRWCWNAVGIRIKGVFRRSTLVLLLIRISTLLKLVKL